MMLHSSPDVVYSLASSPEQNFNLIKEHAVMFIALLCFMCYIHSVAELY